MIDPETQRAGIERLTRWAVIGGSVALGIGGLYALENVFAIALEGALYLAALGVVVLVGWGAAPALGTYVANKRIETLKAAIAANPIETMENLEADKKIELQKQESAITEVDTEFRNVDQLVQGLLKSDPDEAKDYVPIRDKIKEGLDELNIEYDAAATELALFHKQIEKARRIWKVAVAINKALSVSALARSAVFDDIKKQVAFDTVTTNLNRQFARLDTVVKRRRGQNILSGTKQAQAALPSAPAMEVIDLGKVGERIKVNR